MIRLLSLLCGVLLAIVASEAVFRPSPGVHAAPEPAGPPSRQAVKNAAQSPATVNGWVTVALTRPLFAPDRKPIPGTVAAEPGMPRLTGIIASASSAVAIFQPEGDAKPVTARNGERVGGWEVTAIEADSVSLRKDNEIIALSPRFNGVAAKREAKASPSRWEVAAPTGLLRARWSNPQLQP
jgi:general secretion pathway protein N